MVGDNLTLPPKLRHDARLYFPYDGPYSRRGPHRLYGDLEGVATQYLMHVSPEGDIQTCIYQMTLLHHEFAPPKGCPDPPDQSQDLRSGSRLSVQFRFGTPLRPAD